MSRSMSVSACTAPKLLEIPRIESTASRSGLREEADGSMVMLGTVLRPGAVSVGGSSEPECLAGRRVRGGADGVDRVEAVVDHGALDVVDRDRHWRQQE